MSSGREARHRHAASSSDFISDVADRKTATFIKKVLCADREPKELDNTPLDELLPPLTSSNELDTQLYAFIAVIIQENVHSWYSKITTDKEFVHEVIQIIAHCTRTLESRVRKVDVVQLVLDDACALLNAHTEGTCEGKAP